MEQQLSEVLSATLSPHASARQAAESHLTELTALPESCLALASLCVGEGLDPAIRQIRCLARMLYQRATDIVHAAGLALRRYIPLHWSPFFEKFQGHAPPVEIKAQVRELLFRGLGSNQRKIRLACAYATAELAHSDWPDEYPQLMDLLLEALHAGQPDAVDGALRVLTDFVKADLTEDQLLPIAQKMLPHLLTIHTSPSRYSPVSRARALAVFRQSVVTLHTVKEQYPEAVATAMASILPQWLDALAQVLGTDVAADVTDESRWGELAVRTEAFRTLDTVLNGFPKPMHPHVPSLLSISLAHLNSLAPPIRSIYQIEDGDLLAPMLSDESSDVSVDVARLASFILDFVVHLAKKKVAYGHFLEQGAPSQLLANLANLVIHFAQVTTEDEERWAEDMNVFAADDDDYALVFSLRVASYDAAEALVDTFGQPALQALWTAMQSICEQSSASRQTGQEDWWKGIEATLAIAGSLSDSIVNAGETPAIDLSRLFQIAVMPYLEPAAPPYLQGRAFVLASLCAAALPPQLTEQFIQHALNTLAQSNGNVAVKISAVRALMNFFNKLPELTAPHAIRAISLFAPLLPSASESTLVLVIEAIEAALRSGADALDASDARVVFGTLLDVWAKYAADPSVDQAVSGVLAAYAASRATVVEQTLVQTILPQLAQNLAGNPETPLPAAAASLVDAIFTERAAPLGDRFFATVAGALFALLETTDDRQIVQDGLDAITQIVRTDCQQLLSWRDASGSGLDHVLRILSKTLDASQPESGGLFVGDLVIHLLRRAGDAILSVLPDLLRALVNRMPTAQTASFMQSLILPFAYLMYGQFDIVANLLEQLSVDGKSAIEVLVTAWCENVETIQGFWNRRISTVGLARLFVSRRNSIENLPVKGDLIVTQVNRDVIMTRSRKRQNPDQFTSVPFPAKALKILAKELLNLQEDANETENAAVDAEEAVSDDGADDWEEEDGGFTSQKDLAYLTSSLLNADELLDHQADDEDLRDDPVYSINLAAFIVSALKQALAEDSGRVSRLSGSLTQEESDVLRRVVQ